MTTALMRRAIQLYRSPYVSRATNKRNRVAWLFAVQELGPRWVYRNGPAKWGNGNTKETT